MPDKAYIFAFLRDLEANNFKEWMDEHRDRYQKAKEIWLEEIQGILNTLAKHEPQTFVAYRPKDTISRINNNRMFHPDRPVYKTFFSFSVMDESDNFSPMYVSIGPGQSFLGCGYHKPDRETLQKIRDGIDYNGQVLKDLMEESAFHQFFGGLADFSEKLKTSPRGFSKDHPHVELLRYKNFVVSRNLSETEVLSDDFIPMIEKAYLLAQPFRKYLQQAASF